MALLVKIEYKNIPLMGEDPFVATINLPWFFIHIILIQLKLQWEMDFIPLYIICILVCDDDDWTSPWTIQSTDSTNRNRSNIMIIDASNSDMEELGFIYDSNIIPSTPPPPP